MLDGHVDPAFASQVPGHLLSHEYRTMLPACAAEGHHEVLETSALIRTDARIHQRHCVGEKLMDALFLVQVLDNGRVLASETLEPHFTARIRKASTVEDEPATVPRLIQRHTAM